MISDHSDNDDELMIGRASRGLSWMKYLVRLLRKQLLIAGSPKVSNDVQLQPYGLYKIATEGPCNTPQPLALKMTACAKWFNLSQLYIFLYQDLD